MRLQHDNETSCAASTSFPLIDQVVAVGKTTVDSETSYLLSNRLNLCNPALELECSLGFTSLICPTGIGLIGDLDSTGSDNNIDCFQGNGGPASSRPCQSHSSLDCLHSQLNQNEQVMRDGLLSEEYKDENKSSFKPTRRDLSRTGDVMLRNGLNDSAECMKEGRSLNCCWTPDLLFPGEVDTSKRVPSSTSLSPMNTILDLSTAISSSIPSPDISQDVSCQSDDLSISATSSICDLISPFENKKRSDFDAGRNPSKMRTGFGDRNLSSSLSSGSPASIDRFPEAAQEPAVNKLMMQSLTSLRWYQTPSSGAARVTWLCNYGCHKPVSWKYRLCEIEDGGEEAEGQKEREEKEENKELLERNCRSNLFSIDSFRQSRNINEIVTPEQLAPLPLLARRAGVKYSKDFALRFISSRDTDINCNFDQCTENDLESAFNLRINSRAASTSYVTISSCSGQLSGMAEASCKDSATDGGSSRDSDRVAKSNGRSDCRRRETRSINDVSASLQVKVSKLQEQRCNLAKVIGRYYEERKMQQRQLRHLQRMSGSARKKELMVNILRELHLMLGSQMVSLQRSYDQILSRQWWSIFWS